mmetsp:Transcript_34158/g.102996  ORF Transcript_34158/g.102996 Transcript_34158/m.102996 type:complete len:702 (+) Transcript_34158:250-2355(+)
MNDNVQVAVRCRPLSSKEKAQGHNFAVALDTRLGTVDIGPRSFKFDHVFGPDVQQAEVYNRTARGIVSSCLEGYNGTIFAYGQTGTGKTFTMEGERSPPELLGIIPNSFAHIFGTIRDAHEDTRFLVRCSYLEIYCEECFDLLGKDTKKKLKLREHPDKGVYVDGLSPWVVQNVEQLDEVMARGNQNRSTAKTKMNDRSSRSHAIFIMMIERSDKLPDGKNGFRMGRLNLVDLAGSEKQKKTEASGQALVEAAKINLSLTMLGNVIAALVDGSKHIPYRDSTLTRLLKDSLGGNSKTTMIANFGPASYNTDETVSTLRYADRAKRIKNTPKINEDPKDAMLREMQEKIEKLRKQLEEEGSDFETGSSGTEDEGGGAVGWDGQKVKKKKRKKQGDPRRLSPTKLKAIQDQIAREKAELKTETKKTQAERDAAAQALALREDAFRAAQREREQLEEKMQAIQGNLIVGGVNLLDKAEEQERLLQASAQELEEADRAAAELKQDILAAEAEQLTLNEKYASLEEEVAAKTKRMKKVFAMLQAAKAEIDELQRERREHHAEMIDHIKEASRELRRNLLVIQEFIPPDYIRQIEQESTWDEDTGEWNIPALSSTGNAFKTPVAFHVSVGTEVDGESIATSSRKALELDLEKQYFVYGTMIDESRPPKAARPKTSKPKEKVDETQTAKGGPALYPKSRPGTAKPRYA